MSNVIYANEYVDLDEFGLVTYKQDVKNMPVIDLKWTDEDGDWHKFSLDITGKWFEGEQHYVEANANLTWDELGEAIKRFCR